MTDKNETKTLSKPGNKPSKDSKPTHLNKWLSFSAIILALIAIGASATLWQNSKKLANSKTN